MREGLLATDASPEDIALSLASGKASMIKRQDALVLGCDQLLHLRGRFLSKPNSCLEALEHLTLLSGQTHELITGAAIFENGKSVWEHVGSVSMQMHRISSDYVQSYVERNWESIRHSLGGYKLEEEGVRLFQRIDGDYFHVLGLPLLEMLDFLCERRIFAR